MKTNVKMLRSSFKWFIAILLCLGFCFTPVKANTTDYSIEDFHIDATYHKNNTITQTETIQVNYSTPKHGIYQYIPLHFYVGYKDGEEKAGQVDTYAIQVEDVSVKGASYETSSEDGTYQIKIGDADTYVTGSKTYTIQYTLVLPKDYRSNYDFMYYSLIGNDWECAMNHVSFDLHFEKPLTQKEVNGFHLFSGPSRQTTNAANVEYQVTKNGVSGQVNQLAAGSAITILSRLRKNYFVDAYQRSTWMTWLCALLAAIFALLVLIKELQNHDDDITPVITFDPPEDLDPAAVGYIVDGKADDVDMMALIPYWAEKGYVDIEDQSQSEKHPHIIVHAKVDALPTKDPYQTMLFKAMFKKDKSCDFTHMNKKFGEKFVAAKEALHQSFLDERKLEETDSFEYFSLVGLIVFALALFTSSYVGYFYHWYVAIIFVALFVICAWCLNKDIKDSFDKQHHSVWKFLLSLVCFGVWLFFIYTQGTQTDQILPSWVLYGVSILIYLCFFFSYRMHKMSAYWKEKAGPLMGFKDFIQKAEVDQLEKLSAENPSYFYDVIPYAMVFGLAKTWAKKFTNIQIPQPDWYVANDYTFWNTMYFYSMMNHGIQTPVDNSVRSYNAAQAAQQAGSGSGSFGGFSGGGAGGGGGGAW